MLSDIFKIKDREGRRAVLDRYNLSKEDKNEVLNAIDNVSGGQKPKHIGFSIEGPLFGEPFIWCFSYPIELWHGDVDSEYNFYNFVIYSGGVNNMQGFSRESNGIIKFKGATIYKSCEEANWGTYNYSDPVYETDIVEDRIYYIDYNEVTE